MPARLQTLKLSHVVVNNDFQPRKDGLDPHHVGDLADVYRRHADDATVKLPPPPVVYRVGKTFTLSEGFHRLAGARAAGWEELEVEVREGTEAECAVNALTSNKENKAKKRTNEDKRRAVLEVRKYLPKNQSATSIAKLLEVSVSFVSELLAEADPERAKSATVVGADGRTIAKNDGGAKTKAGKKDKQPDDKGDESLTDESASPSARRVVMPGGEEVTVHDGEDGPTVIPPAPGTPAADEWGIPVQPHAAAAFAAVAAFEELERMIRAAQRKFDEVAHAPGGAFLTLPDVCSFRRGRRGGDGEQADRYVHEGLERALRQVEAAKPAHTVCPFAYADGGHPEECRTCLGAGWTPALGGGVPPVLAERAKAAFGVD